LFFRGEKKLKKIITLTLFVLAAVMFERIAFSDVFLAPDGSGTYVGGLPNLMPNGAYVGGTPTTTPDGIYVDGVPKNKNELKSRGQKRKGED
jgi:hypothetical protein